jgi:hypothetical protein
VVSGQWSVSFFKKGAFSVTFLVEARALQQDAPLNGCGICYYDI